MVGTAADAVVGAAPTPVVGAAAGAGVGIDESNSRCAKPVSAARPLSAVRRQSAVASLSAAGVLRAAVVWLLPSGVWLRLWLWRVVIDDVRDAAAVRNTGPVAGAGDRNRFPETRSRAAADAADLHRRSLHRHALGSRRRDR